MHLGLVWKRVDWVALGTGASVALVSSLSPRLLAVHSICEQRGPASALQHLFLCFLCTLLFPEGSCCP